jgi:uncharacterized repeat protein (TIGR01451 family)/uncharacterized delta-60 repeat protein
MRKLQDCCPAKLLNWAGLARLGLIAVIGLFATAGWAQPLNDMFAGAQVLMGTAGTVQGSNVLATAEPGEPDHAENPGGPYASVWYQWTAPSDGVLEVDTEGSALDTELAVYIYTGTNTPAVTNLTEVAQNDDVNYPSDVTSKVTLTVQSGQVYYIAVDGYEDSQGLITLNWQTTTASVNAGQFEFAYDANAAAGVPTINNAPVFLFSDDESTAPPGAANFMTFSPPRLTVTRVGGHAGRVQAYYQITNYFYTNLVFTNVFGSNILFSDSNGVFFTNIFITNIEVINHLEQLDKRGRTIRLVISNDTQIFGTNVWTNKVTGTGTNMMTNMVLIPPTNNVTITNVGTNFTYNCAGNNGPPPSGPLTNGYTNFFCTNYPVFVNLVPTATFGQDYLFTTATNVLDFKDYQMSADITGVFISPSSSIGPWFTVDHQGPFYLNRVLIATVTNVVFDPLENSNLISAPTVSTTLGSAYMNILNMNSVGTNQFYGNAGDIWNLDHVTYQFLEGNGGIARVWVTWNGTNQGPPQTETLSYHLDFGNVADNNDEFPVLPGSDYATPPNAHPQSSQPSDFTDTSGAFTWDINTTYFFDIPITNDNIVEFNEDIWMALYGQSSGVMGQVTNGTMTILFKDQPAGAKDNHYFPANSMDTVPPRVAQTGADEAVNGIAIQPSDGKAIIAGDFTFVDGVAVNSVARINTNGSVDTSFNSCQSCGANGSVSCVALQLDGNVLIGGLFNSFDGAIRPGVARLNAFDGSLDTTFAPGVGIAGGSNGPPSVLAMQVLTNGQILIAGNFTFYNGTNENFIARLNTDGSLDTSFNVGSGPQDALHHSPAVQAMAVQADGKIVIGGQFTSMGGAPRTNIARLNPNGSVDLAFNPGTGADDVVNAIALQPNGGITNIIIGGAFKYVDLVSSPSIARLQPNGAIDQSFSVGTGADDAINTVLVYPSTDTNVGDILIGGAFTTYNGTRRVGVARLFPNGPVDTTFMDTAYNQFAGLINDYFDEPHNYLLSLGLQADGNVLIGGNFYQAGGGTARDVIEPVQNYTRLIGNGTPGPGNIGFASTNYQGAINGGLTYIQLLRTNGFGTNGLCLGPASVTVSIPNATAGSDTNGVAISGADYIFDSANYGNPEWGTSWEAGFHNTWMQSDGLFAFNNDTRAWPFNPTTQFDWSSVSDVKVNIIDTNLLNGNRLMNLTLSNPSSSDIFFLGGENIPAGVGLGISQAQLEIVDNYQPHGTISFSSPTYTVSEGGGQASILVTRSGGTAGQIRVNCATIKGGTAVSGTTQDYIATNTTLIFGEGTSTQTFIVPIVNNTIVRPDRTVFLQLSTPTGGAVLGQSNAVLTIINDNFSPGMLSFTATNFSAQKDSGEATISVNRTGGSTGQISIYYGTSNGTATNGVDYNGVTNLLSWTNGDVAVKTFTVPLINNGLVSSNKTVNLSLFSPVIAGATNNQALGQFTNAMLTVVNDNLYGNLAFSTPTYTVNENGGFATITVVRVGGSSQTVSASFSTVAGTATSPYNYTSTNGTLTFGPGVFTQTFTVPVNDNGVLDQGNTNLFLALTLTTNSLSGGAGLGFPSTATLQIINNETFNEPPGAVDTIFSANAYFNNTVYTLALQGNGQIVCGGDFTAADGIPRNRIARLNGDGTLDLKFSSTSQVEGANSSIRTTVVQTDGRILIGGLFTNVNNVNNSYIARLNYDGSLDSTFNPGGGADNPVYAIAETFDTNGNRKIVIGGSFVTINGNLNSPSAFAQLNNDGSVDATFNATGANGTVYAVQVYSTNDVLNGGKILIGGDFTTVNGVPRNHIARLNADGSVDPLFNPGPGPDSSVRALAIQVDGNVLIGGLFANIAGSPMNHIGRLMPDGSVDPGFTPGVGANDAVTCIAIQEDQKILLGGDFTQASGVTRNRLTRLNPDGTVDPGINFGLGANNFVSAVVIQPDDKILIGGGFTEFNSVNAPYITRIYGRSETGSGELEFVSAGFQVDQNGTNAVIGIRRDGATGDPAIGNVYITFSTSNITAVAGTDYVGVTNVLTFPVGETFQTVTVPIINNSTNGVIAANKIVGLALSNPTDAALGPQPVARLTIININSGVGFATAAYRVNKNSANGVATINITRTGSSSGAASVDFITTTNGTAIPGVDYTPTTNTVFFADGQSNATATVGVINNGLVEGSITVGLMLLNPTNVILLPQNASATLTVVDDSLANGNFMFSATNYSVLQTASYAVITVVRTNGSEGRISVTYATTGGTATPNVDYAPTNGTITFEDGDLITTNTFMVQIFDNPNLTSNVTVNLTLSNPGGTSQILPPVTVPLTIVNQNVDLSFAQFGYFVDETNGSVTIGVTRSGNTNVPVSVQYATTNGTATAGLNYSAVSGLLNFSSNETFQTITIPILYDPQITGNLLFFVNLFGPSGNGQVVAPLSTAISVIDDDSGFEFTTPTNTVIKANTNVLVSVLRLGNTTSNAMVNFNSLGGTAQTGIEFGPTNGTLNFLPGQTSNSFTVPVFSDNEIDGNQTVELNLTNASGASILSPSNEVITVIDTESGVAFSSSGFTVTENGVAAVINVVRTGVTNSTVSVQYSTTTNGTAISGTNYVVTSGTVTFTNGQVSQSFNVPIIDNNVTGGSETVGLMLFNPSSTATLVSPNTATLTIFNNDGSLIVPAGSALTNPTNGNGAINPGQNVTLLLALRNTAGANTTNLMATLLVTNGVTLPSPATAQSYGVLVTNGPSVSRSYSFTANGTNGSVISAVLQLQDGTRNLGTASFSYTLGTTTNSFANNAVITINDDAVATPYPSTIAVSGVSGQIIKLTATLSRFWHGSMSDVAILLVSPTGQEELLFGNVGGRNNATNLNLTIDDSGTPFTTNAPTSGVYAPTQLPLPFQPLQTINFPASTNGTTLLPGPYGLSLSSFIGEPLNGTWSLYVLDDVAAFSGAINNGWSLTINTVNVVTPTVDLVVGMSSSPGTVIVTSNLTYVISVTNAGPSTATNVTVSDVLPAGVAYVQSSAGGSYSTNTGAVTFNLGSLPMNGVTNFSLVVSPTALGLITNTASAGASQVEANPANNVATIVTTVIAATADLAIGMSDVPNPILVGNNLTYTITVTNLGPATATGVIVTNVLPPKAVFVSGGTYSTNGGGTVTVNLGSLGSGASTTANIVIQPTVPGLVSATAGVASGVPDPLKGNNTVSVKTAVQLQLSAARTANSLKFSWPSTTSGYVLKSTPDLKPPITWTTVTNGVVPVGGQNTVTITIGPGSKFFELAPAP